MILQVDSMKLNQALTMLGNLSGDVSFLKVQPIIQTIQESIVPEEELSATGKPRSITPEKDLCLSPIPQKTSLQKLETEPSLET